MKQYEVVIVGVTGAVGQEMLKIVTERKFPVSKMRAMASERSRGKTIEYNGQKIEVEVLGEAPFNKGEIVLSSAGASRSKEFAPGAVKAGAIVIDNTSAFRQEPDVPLVVPEVNPHHLDKHKGLISNPNCSTIAMLVAIAPLHFKFKIKRIIVSTYQSVSGAGAKAIEEMLEQSRALLEGREYPPKVFPHQIAFNTLPHIDVFFDNGFTKEEMKMVNETHKMLDDDSIAVTATTIRVPVVRGHSESIYIETEKKVTADAAREVLRKAPSVKVVDDPANKVYPMPIDCAYKDDTLVGRIREDLFVENGLNLWIASDNLRKGAALNAVQIAETMIERGLI